MFKNIDDDFEKGDGDVSSVYGFFNSHTLFQREDSITSNYIDGGVDKGGVSSVYGSMNSHTDLQKKHLE